MLWHGVMWFGVMLCPVVWFGDYVQVMGMHSVSSPYASYHMLNKSLFDKNNKSYNRVTTRMTVATQNDRVSTQLRASLCVLFTIWRWPMGSNHRMYQREVDVDTPNAVKSVLANVSSVSPSSELSTLLIDRSRSSFDWSSLFARRNICHM